MADSHKPLDQKKEPGETVATSFAVSKAIWLRVKNFAGERRIPAQAVWLAAVVEYMDREEQKKEQR